jgi:phosphopantetheine adenylyltransferase
MKITSGHHQLQKDSSNVLNGVFIAIMDTTEKQTAIASAALKGKRLQMLIPLDAILLNRQSTHSPVK